MYIETFNFHNSIFAYITIYELNDLFTRTHTVSKSYEALSKNLASSCETSPNRKLRILI